MSEKPDRFGSPCPVPQGKEAEEALSRLREHLFGTSGPVPVTPRYCEAPLNEILERLGIEPISGEVGTRVVRAEFAWLPIELH